MKKSPHITKAKFETWLKKQKNWRNFEYHSHTECLVGSFLNETYTSMRFSVGGFYYRKISNNKIYIIPSWLRGIMVSLNFQNLTIYNIKKQFYARNKPTNNSRVANK